MAWRTHRKFLGMGIGAIAFPLLGCGSDSKTPLENDGSAGMPEGAGGSAGIPGMPGGSGGEGGSSDPRDGGEGGSGDGGTGGTGSDDSGAPMCDPGVTTTQWAEGCPVGRTETCIPGSFGITNPSTMPPVRAESAHFALRWEDNLVSEQQAATGLANFERAWDELINRLGFPEPFCDSATKYKVNVHLDSSFGFTGSGTGDRNPGMWVNPSGLNNMWVLAHEFTHTLQFATRGLRNSDYVGWMWESHANWMAHQLEQHRDRLDCAEMLVNSPHLYYGSTRNRYCNWQFWEFLKDKHCYQAVHDIWALAPKSTESSRLTEDPFSVLMRNRGWSVSELNDFFGEWAMHNVTWDYRDPDGTDQGAVYRNAWTYSGTGITGGSPAGNRRLRVTRLEAMDAEQRRYAVPSYWAPQRWGYNLVRLHPDVSSQDTAVTVSFRGVLQEAAANTNFAPYTETPSTVPPPDSDFRWGLVAVDATGKPRYSTLQRGTDAELCFQVQADDTALWLVVVATPSSIQKILWDQKYFTIYRYPWMVQVDGALPGGHEPGAPNPTDSGGPHPNGGGWVASGAEVAASAYVGPHAMVLGGTVSDTARIEDHATVLGGTVSGQAVVGALSLINNVSIGGSARVGTVFRGVGSFESGQSVSGTAQIYGDIELRNPGLSLTSGVFYGYVDSALSSQNQHGANVSTPPTEVTAPGPYVFRP